MGAGASIANKTNHHQHSDNVSTHTTRSANSVRAMALKNHARQENSYIPPDRLRSKFSKNVQHGSSAEYTSEPRSKGASVERREAVKEIQAQPSSSTASPATGSLVQFKSMMNLNLKLNLEDDNDWGKVTTSNLTAIIITCVTTFSFCRCLMMTKTKTT